MGERSPFSSQWANIGISRESLLFGVGVVAGLAAVRAGNKIVECRGQLIPELTVVDPGDKVILWVNGIDTSRQKFIETLNHLWGFFNLSADGAPKLCGFHNESIGRNLDKVQVAQQIVSARLGRYPAVSREIARQLAQEVTRMAEKGAKVVVLAHSQGALISREAANFVPDNLRDRVAYISLGDPHGAHPAANWGTHIGILNERDYIVKYRGPLSDTTTVKVSSPEQDPGRSHTSQQGYLVPSSDIGICIQEAVGFLFGALD